MISCGVCGLLRRPPAEARRGGLLCPSCGAALHPRKPHSLLRTWILLIAGLLCYLPANLLPVTISTSFGSRQTDTIISGVIYFINTGSWPLAVIIFIASIVVPMVKLMSLGYLALSVQLKSRWRPEQRTSLYRVTELIGRWSMMDIFVIMVLVALVRMQAVASFEVGPGAFFFGAVVIITMMAARAFDPRLIWDACADSCLRR